MFHEREIPDSASKFFEDFRAYSGLPKFPMTELQLAGFKRLLELQLFMMKRYRSALNDQLTHDPMHEMMSQMAKKFMSNIIEFNKFSQTYRRKATEMQLDGVEQMIQMCEEFLNSIDMEPRPPENASSDAKEDV